MAEEKKPFRETAKYKANNNYIKDHYKQVKLSMPNEEADTLRAFCEAQGQSIAGLIRELVKERISNDLHFDHKKAEYLLRAIYPDKTTEIIGKYKDKETALEEGKRLFENAEKGTTISCIKGVIGDDGKIEGRYLLYDSWS